MATSLRPTDVLVFASLTLLLAAPLRGDILVLKSGERREGRVEAVEGKPGSVALITAAGRIELDSSRVEETIEEPDAIDFTKVGGQLFDAKRYPMAVQMYQKAVAADPNYAPARDGLSKALYMIKSQEEEASSARQRKNSEVLAGLSDGISRGDFEKMEQMLNSIEAGTPSEQQQQALKKGRRDLYLAWGRSRLDKLDNLGAEKYFKKVLEADPKNAEAREGLLGSWENDPAHRAEVLEAYQQKMQEHPEDLTINKKVADLFAQLQRPVEAIPALLKLHESGKFAALGYDDRLRNALEQGARDHAGKGEYDAAIQYYSKLVDVFPDADRTPLAYLDYQKKLAKIEPNDWNGRAALLSGLRAEGMEALAVQEAELIIANDPNNKAAMDVLRADAQAALADIQDTFRKGEFVLAREEAKKYTQKYVRFPQFVQQASDLYTKADIEAQRQAKRVAEAARRVAEQGEAYYASAVAAADQMKSKERTDRTTVISYKQNSIRDCKRSIEAFQTALSMDPSLGLITGMDLNNKLNDSKALYKSLTAAPYVQGNRQLLPNSSAVGYGDNSYKGK